MNITLRKAKPGDTTRLTEIAFAAKQTWNYPDEYMKQWKDELTITEDYLKENEVVVAEYRKKVIGFYSIVTLQADKDFGNVPVERGFWMDHLFIDPHYQKKGIGSLMVKRALDYCNENWIDVLKIFVDPNATGFYEKMGATFVRNSPSSIENREIPVFAFYLEEE